MPKVRVTALVMFALQIKKSLELKRSKLDDSYEEWSICQSPLRPAASLFRPVGHSLRPATYPFRPAVKHVEAPIRSAHVLRPVTSSLRPATTSQKSAQNPLTTSTSCGPQ